MRIALPYVAFCLSLLTPVCVWGAQSDSSGDVSRVLAKGQKPNDVRLEEPKDLDGYFPLHAPTTLAAWEARSAEVRQRILVANGLWPMPARPAIEATIHGRVYRDDYTVDKVYFESYPGFFVTGNLYRPRYQQGPFPVVLSPHGHYANGRFHDAGLNAVRQQIFLGEERFQVGGRHPLQSRCVQLARMGCVVFHYDMVGYADSTQISYELAHRHAEPRPEMENLRQWGLFSAQAEMRLQTVMGLQTFNSLRALDFVLTLPDVDADRVAVTGSSGGGTQTMMLAAIDPRVRVSFPAVMVSTAMQGGCTCENASCLRVGTGNVEFAALFAPKPQGINDANDWTVEMDKKGLPELMQVYRLYGANPQLALYHLPQFPHNYNYVSRGKMYHWMNRFLELGLEEPIVEEDYQPLSIEEMSVWNDQHPAPPSGDAFERAFLQGVAAASDRQILAIRPHDKESMEEFRNVVGSAWETVLATSWRDRPTVTRAMVAKEDQGSYWLFRDLLRGSDGTELPTCFVHPKQWNGEVVLWAAGTGKSSLFAKDELRAEVSQLVQAGYAVAACDLFEQGEFVDGNVPTESRKVANPRDCAGYTFGYNRTVAGDRVHDLLTLLKFVQADEHQPKKIHFLGVEGAAPLVLLAASLAGDQVDRIAVDNLDFRFSNVTSWRDPNFVPGAIKYGDLPAVVALCATHSVWGSSNREVDRWIGDLFRQLGGELTVLREDRPVEQAVRWLVQP